MTITTTVYLCQSSQRLRNPLAATQLFCPIRPQGAGVVLNRATGLSLPSLDRFNPQTAASATRTLSYTVCQPRSEDSKAQVAPGSLPGCLHVAPLGREVWGKKRWQLVPLPAL